VEATRHIPIFPPFLAGISLVSLITSLVIVGVVVYAATATPAPPIVYTQPGVVAEIAARSGDLIHITRHFRVTNNTPIRIARAVVSGDCTTLCRVYEMPESAVVNQTPGDYVQTRPLRLPNDMEPGTYRLVFIAHWSTWWGRDLQVKIPELTIEVIK
jgi:hypothetical protein